MYKHGASLNKRTHTVKDLRRIWLVLGDPNGHWISWLASPTEHQTCRFLGVLFKNNVTHHYYASAETDIMNIDEQENQWT